ncbi:hypothetical protein CEXT_641651 [Caerostris extrusa]|uniref:Uncharacterized protein n=1 Tax=Caerostris extrusa TaxID=172846 RepID=A0AAV4QNN5_CAEEX|nr:hypothetical protein CEXT_641651 [Caerostris extrusa]
MSSQFRRFVSHGNHAFVLFEKYLSSVEKAGIRTLIENKLRSFTSELVTECNVEIQIVKQPFDIRTPRKEYLFFADYFRNVRRQCFLSNSCCDLLNEATNRV